MSYFWKKPGILGPESLHIKDLYRYLLVCGYSVRHLYSPTDKEKIHNEFSHMFLGSEKIYTVVVSDQVDDRAIIYLQEENEK